MKLYRYFCILGVEGQNVFWQQTLVCLRCKFLRKKISEYKTQEFLLEIPLNIEMLF